MSRQSFLDPVAVADAAAGDLVSLSPSEAHHARVKRVAPGEAIDVVDGAGARFVCEVVASSSEEVSVRVVRVETARKGGARTVLVQALSKQDRDLQAVETCVEIGVDTVIPWQADRSIVRWREERAAKAHAKWISQVAAAVKQSRRASVPEVEELRTTRALVARAADVVRAGGLVLVLHEAASLPLPAAMREWASSVRGDGGEILLVVGPEGGISEQELASLEAVGARSVVLGETVLRASTAGAVALVLVLAAQGVFGTPPPAPSAD